jgi:hypothetical protein
MNRSYTAQSPYSLTPTERIDTYADEGIDEYEFDGLREADEFGDYLDYDEARIDRRWMWVAGIAGLVLFVALVTTGVILGGGDSGSVSSTMTSSAAPSSAPATTAAVPPAASAPRGAVVPSLTPETVTTVTPSPTADVVPPPVEAAPPPPAVSPRTITYRVTGNRQLIDLVTVIYTDSQGALQTDVNVALPWAKTVVLDPGVELKSVTATSVAGQLNCGIYDAGGALIAVQNNNTMIANCTQ